MTAREFRLVMPMTRLINSNKKEHWAPAAAKRKEMRTTARQHCADLEPIKGAATLLITFMFPDRRHRDVDNYEAKGAIDGAVDAGLISDDRSTVLTHVERVGSDYLSPKGYAVLVFTFRPAGEEVA